jgi:hypothetical protein
MTMGIRMVVKTERGEVVFLGGIYSPPEGPLDPRLYPLLSGIDPYGDTVFNRAQAERLVTEAALLSRDATLRSESTGLEDIEALYAAYVRSPPHRYLWFVGD